MRRLWAHIIIAFTCIVSSLAAFPTVLKSITTNGDYETRRQFTFQLSEREYDPDGDPVIALEDDSASKMASIMESRLVSAGVTSYEITTTGNDLVNVAFSSDNNTLYNQITTYLSFSGSFALMNSDPDSEPIPAKDFLNGNAYLKEASTNEYPTIIIPVNTTTSAYEALVEWARNNPVAGETDENGNEGESTAPMYIIYNYVKGDTYKTLTDNNKFNEKILLTFDATDDNTLYYDDNKNSFSYVCGYQDSNGNGYADPSEVKFAYDQADFLYNLFNASALDYEVELIRGLDSGTEVWLTSAVENIFTYGKFTWNNTLTAIVAAIVIISLLLVFFYRLGALSVVTTTITSTFLSFLFLVITGLEYNILAVAALAIVAFLSILSGVIYLSKLKDESYRGRTLKKANSEAARKSTLPVADIHVVSVVVGLLLYLLGGAALHTFSSILVLGSLASALINLLGLRGMMWLATNTTGLTGKYEVFGIDPEKVPDHMADEKQTFYGAYADKDFTTKKKPVFIVGASLFVVALAGLITMGALKGGNLFRSAQSRVTGNEILISETIKVLDDEKSRFNEDAIHEILGNMKVYTTAGETVTWDEADTHKTLDSYVTNIASYSVSDSKTVEGTTTNYLDSYYEIKLSSIIDANTAYLKVKGYDAGDMTINEVFEVYFEDINLDYSTSVSNSIELKKIATFTNEQNPKWDKVFLATSIAIAALTLYFMIRYRLSRGLAMIAFPVVSSVVNLGLFVLLSAVGLSLPASILVSVPVVTMFAFFFSVIIANKERDMVVEDKVKDKSYEHRLELSKRALGIAMTPVFATVVIGAYLFVNFFGFGPSITSYLYLACLFGVIIAMALVVYAYIPLSNIFYKAFSKINFEPKIRKSKKGNAPAKKKSAEPEEAIFIGIND